jgi:hypothetical protein
MLNSANPLRGFASVSPVVLYSLRSVSIYCSNNAVAGLRCENDNERENYLEQGHSNFNGCPHDQKSMYVDCIIFIYESGLLNI